MIVRTQTLREPYAHIFSGDDALDHEAEGFAETFLRAVEASDLSIVPTKSGQKPAVWKLRHLGAREAAWLRDQHSAAGGGMAQALLHAVALGIVGVEGAIGSDGKAIAIKTAPDPTRQGFTCVVEEQLESIFGPHNAALVAELGGRVVATLRPPKG